MPTTTENKVKYTETNELVPDTELTAEEALNIITGVTQ